jgi:GNAT superfamily N-acetyltransferase
MVAEPTLRPGTPADTGRILELVRRSLGEGRIPREPGYWRWKHEENPFGASPVLLAEAAGELVGLRVFMRWQWLTDDRCVPAVRAVDTATHPDWQGRGIFRKLTLALVERMREEGVHFVFNTPNTQSRPGYLKMGWSSLGRTSLYLRPLRPLRLLKAALRGRRAGNGAGEPGEPGADPPGALPAAALRDAPGLPDFLESLRAEGDGRLATPRTAHYLHWRYAQVPGFRYHAVWELAGRDGAVVLFRRKAQAALTELRLCEVLVGPGRRSGKMARALLGRVVRTADAHYVSAMAAPGTPEQRALLRSAFLPAPRLGPVFTVRSLDPAPGATPLLRRSAWRLSIGDLELF